MEIFRWSGVVSPSQAQADFHERTATPEDLAQFQGGQTFAEFLNGSELWKFLVPQALKDLGKQVTWRSVNPSSYPMEDVKSSLRPRTRDVADRTSRLLDRDFLEWLTMSGEG